MQIAITEKAAQQIREVLNGKLGAGLRLAIEEGGCCGVAYSLALAESHSEEDTMAESQGIKVYVPRVQEDQLAGATIDYVETPVGAGFSVARAAPMGGHEQGHRHGGHGAGHGCACGSGGSGGCGC